MRVLAVLEKEEGLPMIAQMLSSLAPEAELLCFGNGLPALAAVREREIDVALLDVKLPELSGLDFGGYLRELYPLVNLIYISDGPEDALHALQQHASGYLLRPLSEKTLSTELEDLRHPLSQQREKRVFAQTFGHFELFADGKPVAFKYSRTKEMVALLVNNRGAQTTNGEIIATLWEDDGDPEKKSSYLSNLRQDLQNTLTRLKLGGIILKQRGSLAIAADRIECDLYDWLEKREASRYRYLGDYMNQYSWPETMHAMLDEISWSLEEKE